MSNVIVYKTMISTWDFASIVAGVCILFTFTSSLSIARSTNETSGEDSSKLVVQESPSRLSDEALPLQIQGMPDRPRLLVEMGEPFLSTGPLGEEITLPTGAVWRPSFWVFGTYRTAVQIFDDGVTSQGVAGGDTRASEWANRLDIFGNLKLSGTERILIGFRPLDRGNRYSGQLFQPQVEFQDQFNAVIRTLFFEGEFGELFPNWDEDESKGLDIGFSIGRQGLLFQEGLLINTGGLGTIDALGITRDTLLIPGTSNVRLTALYGWNKVFRDDNREDGKAQLFGLFTETDFRITMVDVDLVYINSPTSAGDAFFAGIRAVQRLREFNTTLMINSSFPMDGETPQTRRGTLLFGQLSWKPTGNQNLWYANTYWGVDEFSSAIRGPETGGPLGRVGILFEAVGLGRYGSALNSFPDNSVGGSLGHQMFFDNTRKQLVFEVGGRTDTNNTDAIANKGALAAGARYQQAVGQHYILQFDTFGSLQENRNPGFGGRIELQAKF